MLNETVDKIEEIKKA